MKKIIIAIFIIGLIVLGNYFYTKEEVTVGDEKSMMSFFVTSSNPGKGGDLGGLVGADAYCSMLAEKSGVLSKTWKAYLSTTGEEGENARDRIGSGPWHNAKGELLASNLSDLHGENLLAKSTALDENGNVVQGRGDTPNMHDILTGSLGDGTADNQTSSDTTCANWTSSGTGSALVGHHDRVGINDSEAMKSWNSSHLTRGCDVESLKSTGGAGLFYCFAK